MENMTDGMEEPGAGLDKESGLAFNHQEVADLCEELGLYKDGNILDNPSYLKAIFRASLELPDTLVEIDRLVAENKEMLDLIKHIETMQPNAIDIIREHGFIFKTRLPTVFENPKGEKSSEEWEKLAFTFYSDICDLDSRVRQLKEAERE